MNQSSSSGGSGKKTNPREVLKVKLTGFADGLDMSMRGEGIKGDHKIFVLSNWEDEAAFI